MCVLTFKNSCMDLSANLKEDDFQNPEERVYLVPLGRCIMKQEQ